MISDTTIFNCPVYILPRTNNRAGNITPIEGNKDVPFEIKRVFYLYDIPGGEKRGAHAHKLCHQLLIAVSGSFDVVLDDGRNIKTVTLNRPFHCVHILPGIWASQINFSSGAVCLVVTSECYDEEDYIRNYDDFLLFKDVR